MGLSYSGSYYENLKLGREMSSEANLGIMVYLEDVPVWFGKAYLTEGVPISTEGVIRQAHRPKCLFGTISKLAILDMYLHFTQILMHTPKQFQGA